MNENINASSMVFSKCEIILNNFMENPSCAHGPTVLFSRNGKRFFACSAFRSRDLCQFYLEYEEHYAQQNKSVKHKQNQVSKCSISPGSSDLQFKSSRKGLSPTDNKGQAQYYFSESTLQFLLDTLKYLKVSNILCIGTPSIHSAFQPSSYLLDIDDSFETRVQNFSLYNMCNHYFFKCKTNYMNFLESSKNLTIICDPAFGARLELLFNTFRLINCERRSFGHKKPAKVFLIHPYFSEGKILKLDSTIKMSDYRIEYESHKKFKKGEKSPIRLFTNINLKKLKLPEENYKYCDQCLKFVFNISKHCDICQCCDSRDGKNYEHCYECMKCVKDTWSHCSKCNSCHFRDNCKLVANKRKIS